MARPWKQPRIAWSTLFSELRPVLANPPIYALITVFAPQVSQPNLHWQNNEPVNNNWSHLTPFALEKEYSEHSHTETTFPPDFDDHYIQFSVL